MKNKGILIIGEMHGNSCHKITYELLGKGRTLAAELNCRVDCLLLADEYKDPGELNRRGADTVYYMKSSSFAEPEEVLYKENIGNFIIEKKPEIVLIGATHLGRSLAPRLAGSLKTGLTADCTDLKIDENGRLIQIRPAFSENILAYIKTKTMPQIATVRYKEFQEADYSEIKAENVVTCEPVYREYPATKILRIEKNLANDITEEKIIVAGGRGFKRKEDLKLLSDLADQIGGQVGYSRALVDAKMADSRFQVGYSGSRVKPDLYIACGISGAPQHIAGMKESGKIIAINSDASAPIFNICDYGYVGDLYEIMPRLTEDLAGRFE